MTKLLPLWVGARGVEFDWKYMQMSFDANISLVRLKQCLVVVVIIVIVATFVVYPIYVCEVTPFRILVLKGPQVILSDFDNVWSNFLLQG